MFTHITPGGLQVYYSWTIHDNKIIRTRVLSHCSSVPWCMWLCRRVEINTTVFIHILCSLSTRNHENAKSALCNETEMTCLCSSFVSFLQGKIYWVATAIFNGEWVISCCQLSESFDNSTNLFFAFLQTK